MIVKNEEANLEPCIEPLLSVLDEIIVVDTGSTDQTKEIAGRLGAKVYDFPWCDDFSAARNESIRHATGDYILWLDADDRMDSENVNKLKQLKKMFPIKRDQAYYAVIYSESPLDGEAQFLQLRVFPKREGIGFEGRIHEQIFHILLKKGIQLVQTDLRIRHTGYHDLQTNIEKAKRNLSLIEEELKRDPENPLLHYHAARTLSGLGRHRDAISYMEKITENPHVRTNEKRLFFEASLLLGKYHFYIKEYSKALSIYNELATEFQDESLIQLFLGEVLFFLKEYERAEKHLNQSLSRPMKVTFFPLNLGQLTFYQHFFLGSCYAEMGKPDLAREMFLKSLNGGREDYKALEALGLLSLKQKKFEEAANFYGKAIDAGAGSDKNYANLGLVQKKLGLWKQAEESFKKALEINPHGVEALTNLGHLYYEQKDYAQAEDCFTRSLNFHPDLKDVRIALSEIYFRRYELDRLVEQCDHLLKDSDLPRTRVIESFRDLGGLYREIGDVLFKRGFLASALMAYQVAFLIHTDRVVMEKIQKIGKILGKEKESHYKVQEAIIFWKERGLWEGLSDQASA